MTNTKSINNTILQVLSYAVVSHEGLHNIYQLLLQCCFHPLDATTGEGGVGGQTV